MGNTGGVVKPYRYLSLDELAKKRILKQQLEGIEAEHFAVCVRRDALAALDLAEDSPLKASNDADLVALRDRQAYLESLAAQYKEELAAIDAEIDKKEEQNG